MNGNHTASTPLEGEVCSQFVRCGKPSCRCQNGQLHGPYYYRVWRVGSHVQKVYVKAAEVELVRQQCEMHRQLAQSLRDVRLQRTAMTQRIQREWRRAQRMLKK